MDILPHLNAARILVVEDDLVSSERVVKLLRTAGYYVQNAYNTGDAMAVDHTRFDLALVNEKMRDREGHSILQQIQQNPTFNKLPVLQISSLGPDKLLT